MGRNRSADVLFENEDMISPVFAETMLRISAEYEGKRQLRREAIQAAMSSAPRFPKNWQQREPLWKN